MVTPTFVLVPASFLVPASVLAPAVLLAPVAVVDLDDVSVLSLDEFCCANAIEQPATATVDKAIRILSNLRPG